MSGRVFVILRQHLDKPAGYTVTSVSIALVRDTVYRIGPDRIHRTVLFIYRVVTEPGRIIRPEELKRIFRTEEESLLRNNLLIRTTDDMMEIAMIAIPYDRIFGVIYTVPFAFPFAGPFLFVIIQECRMNEVA